MDKLNQRIFQNIEDPSVTKCTKYFAKKNTKWVKRKPTLTRTLYQIGGVTAPRGEKRKNSGAIPVKTASKALCTFKHRGSGAATSGRRVNDMPAHSLNIRLDTGDDEADDENQIYRCEALTSTTKEKQKETAFFG